ncbi:MAG: DUF6497 family protein [Paracoccaceae bacterium]
MDLSAPSGAAMTLFDIRTAPERDDAAMGLDMPPARVRAVQPGLTLDGFLDASPDMAWLCDTYGVPAARAARPAPDVIAVTLSDREVEFRVVDPEAVQFVSFYDVVDGACVEQDDF